VTSASTSADADASELATSADARAVVFKLDCGREPKCVAFGDVVLWQKGATTATEDASRYADAKRRCDGGNVAECEAVGERLLNGRGIARDERRARQVFAKACDDGNVVACDSLGAMLVTGSGGDIDVAHGVAMFMRACRRGQRDVDSGCAHYKSIARYLTKSEALAAKAEDAREPDSEASATSGPAAAQTSTFNGDVTIAPFPESAQTDVAAALTRNKFRFRTCYASAWHADPTMRGEARLTISFAPSVAIAAKAKSTTLSPKFLACIERAVTSGSWTFASDVQLDLALTFAPKA
jgi:hypothetical protein